MEEFSKTSVWELLKILQRKIKYNALLIQKNLKTIEIVKINYSTSTKREKIIKSIYKRNVELTGENTTLLSLNNSLYKFYNQFKSLLNETSNHTDEKVNKESKSWKEYREECMKKSISGDLQINNNHPFINDQAFFSELMNQCKSLEFYERCSEIKYVKSKANISH